MALPPGLRALAIGDPQAPHCLELYVDFTCPFSKKQLSGVNEHLLPLISTSGEYNNKVRILLRPYPQPWHSTSPLLTEAAVAVARLAKPRGTSSEYEAEWQKLCNAEENAAWVFAKALFEEQEKYFDGPAKNKNADQIRAELASLVISTLGEAPRVTKGRPLLQAPEKGLPLGQAIKNLLRVEKEGNAGSQVVGDVKWCVKMGRQNGIHVTPTAVWDGLVQPAISSSFGAEEWKKFLDEQVGGS
ncbi:Thioredoxin-like fold [Ceraceosorus bombacis]|uniref:Thioredoxin-like fold n=1 Tax=Ceraceosorus bombacis TaxID=401625 RepID=A0A0P1BG59_9BASI|nr:Thioredoxin-like fold [Ceraceosorus bombacis]